MFKSVSLQDMDLTNSGQPIFRSESLPHIRELYEQQQNELVEVAPEKNADYKVGDEVVVDLPTRTIEGKIGYVGETDVRIDTSAHGQSWDNEVINKQQFEDGLRQDEPTPDEELDKLPISTEVNGEWQTFPNAAAANEALNAEPVPEAAGNFHITDDNLGVGGPKQKFARNIEAIQTLRTLEQEHGYCLNLDLPQLRRMAYLLQNCSNNLNQYAKRANECGKVYAADMEDLRQRLDELIDIGKQILSKLAEL